MSGAGLVMLGLENQRETGIRSGTMVRPSHKSLSSNSAIFIKERSNPILSGRLPWIGMTILSRRPAMTKIW
jgi:hypothetical protein